MIQSDQRNRTKEEFLKQGYSILDHFLPEQQCSQFLAAIQQFRQEHPLPEIYRQVRGRSLRYRVIDGEKIAQHLPDIAHLYREVNTFAKEVSGEDLAPLQNKKVGANVNITSRGGVYRWHYDRNAVTVLIYLNEVVGGEIELYPNYRIYLKNGAPARLQNRLDDLLSLEIVRKLAGKKVAVRPVRGRLVIMRGNRCLHSVRPVEGNEDRINMVFAYDAPNAQFAAEAKLDTYLYTQEPVASEPTHT